MSARGQRFSPADSFREFRGLMRDLNNRTLKFTKFDSILKHGHYDPGNLSAALRALFGDAPAEGLPAQPDHPHL